MTLEEFMVEVVLQGGGVLLIIATIAAIVGPIITSADDPKSLIKPLAAFVGLAILLFIGYSMATGQEYIIKSGDETTTVTAETSRWVGGSLIMLYILGAVAIVSIIYTEISKYFK